jgi:hypothetical protein
VAFLSLVLFFLLSKPWTLGLDFWETAATVRELSIHPFHPNHPLYALPGDQSARFNPYTLFWGILKRVTGMEIFSTMVIAGLVNYLIFSVGLFLFVSDKFGSRSLPLLTFVIMLWVWETGYIYANAYHLYAFLITLPYVGVFAFALTLNSLYFLNRFCTEGKKRDLLFYIVLSVVVFITHPITGLFCYATSSALLMEFKQWKRLLILQGIPLFALGCSLLWPYFSYADLFTKNAVTSAVQSPLFHNQISALGFALLGIPIMIFYAWKKQHSFILYGFLLCAIIYGFSFFADIPIGSRFILYSTFFLHLSLALFVQNAVILNSQHSLRFPKFLFVLIFILIIPGIYRVREMAQQIIFDQGSGIHGRSPIQPYLFLIGQLTDGNIVLAADWREGFPIPAITGARIVEPRNSFTLLMQQESAQRKANAQSFFLSPLSHEKRISMIRKYMITHILINLKDQTKWDPSFREDLTSIATEAGRNGSIILYKIVI